jgi:hypothetical protein
MQLTRILIEINTERISTIGILVEKTIKPTIPKSKKTNGYSSTKFHMITKKSKINGRKWIIK